MSAVAKNGALACVVVASFCWIALSVNVISDARIFWVFIAGTFLFQSLFWLNEILEQRL